MYCIFYVNYTLTVKSIFGQVLPILSGTFSFKRVLTQVLIEDGVSLVINSISYIYYIVYYIIYIYSILTSVIMYPPSCSEYILHNHIRVGRFSKCTNSNFKNNKKQVHPKIFSYIKTTKRLFLQKKTFIVHLSFHLEMF